MEIIRIYILTLNKIFYICIHFDFIYCKSESEGLVFWLFIDLFSNWDDLEEENVFINSWCKRCEGGGGGGGGGVEFTLCVEDIFSL